MSTSAYREFTGKSVEEALRTAREDFGVGLDDLDFEILTPGSRGVLGMGAEPARILAAPRSELGGAAPKREAAAQRPLPPPPPREDREDRGHGRGFDRDRGGFGDRDRGGFGDRGPRRDDRGGGFADRGPRPDDRGVGGRDRASFGDRGPRRDDRGAGDRAGFRDRPREDRNDAPEGVPVMDDAATEARPPEDRPPRRDDRGERGGFRDRARARSGLVRIDHEKAGETIAGIGARAASKAPVSLVVALPT